MIDNITLTKDCEAPNALLNADGRPFEYRGVIYYPKYSDGKPYRYEGQLKNLRLHWYLNRLQIYNSIHKYWHGYNFTDFHLNEMHDAIDSLSDCVGVNLKFAAVKTLEYGCNVKTNAAITYESMQSFKGKSYLAMRSRGKVYGAISELTDYKIKGYDKTMQLKLSENINLGYPLFRWEIAQDRMRGIEKVLNVSQLTVSRLLLPQTWEILANDAILKYQTSIKMRMLNLHKIDDIETLKKLAVMMLPQFRDYVKTHNRESYKNYKRIYKQIMSNRSICEVDDIAELLKDKFGQLINDQASLLRA